MAPTQGELLEAANRINRKIAVQRNPKMADSTVELAAPPHPSELKITNDDEDPFNGNMNNRRVAERIANSKERKYLNNSQPIHTGDPNKAAADVAKSKAVNPDVPEAKPGTKSTLPSLPTVAQSPDPGPDKSAADALAEQTAKAAGKPAGKPAAEWKPNA